MIYSDEIKREALRLYYREGLGARRICKRLGIRCSASVRYWVINYSVFGESSFDRRKNAARLPSQPPMSFIGIVRNWIRKTKGFVLKTPSFRERWTFNDLTKNMN